MKEPYGVAPESCVTRAERLTRSVDRGTSGRCIELRKFWSGVPTAS